MKDATDLSHAIPDPPQPHPSAPRRRQPIEPDPMFDEFWATYPRKVGKIGAQRAWQQVRRKADPANVIAAAKLFARKCRSDGTETKYIPHPAKWLRDGRYADEVTAAPTPTAPSDAPPSRLNGEQVLAAVISLAANREHPVSAAKEIMRLVRQHAPSGDTEGFPLVTAERGAALAGMPYPEYLLTPEWKERRRAAIKRAGCRCQVCNRDRALHVHHRTYERRGMEEPGDLTVLCDECHALFHGKGLIPSAPPAA